MAKRELTTIEAVITDLGGKQAVADLAGVSWSAVWNWQDRNAFPPSTYAVLKAALKRKGADAPDAMWGMKVVEQQVAS